MAHWTSDATSAWPFLAGVLLLAVMIGLIAGLGSW